MPACSNCGFDNPSDARFCNQCGTPVTAQSDRRGERRQITVAFSDLSGFTAMSERLDPEDVQSIMGEIFSEATEIIERYSGRVDKLLGDAVMYVFGDPTAHEDDAERAVRAAIEIHDSVDKLSPTYEERIGRPLRMHTGINTGVVVTSSTSIDSADAGPLGDTINLAARLEDLSETGEILLGPTTAALVNNVFELEDRGEHDMKGKSGPVSVMKVAGLKHERLEASRRQAAFVGRHEELGILMAAVERVQDGEGSVIGIRAEAGAGKTRLLEEFHDRVSDKVQWLEGRAYAYGENIPYAALVDLISNAIGVGETDTPDTIATKLRTEVGSLVEDTDRVLDPFVRLYGLPEREGAALDKDSFQDRLLASLNAVVDGLCKRAPTVLVLQDLHWADPSTIGIITELVKSVESPIVIAANYRPSFTGTLPNLREIDLAALSPRQSREMVTSLLEGRDPPSELVDFVVERTDGNPFYVEEIINSLIETGTLVRNESHWLVEGSLNDADVPTSIRGVIAARIDRLDTDRRRVLREASVVGREFLYEVIKRVATATGTLDPSLADLENADLIRERNRQSDLEYFFKHALTQDVAYEGLLKRERTELHARAASAIEAQFANRLEEVTETLAFHYTQGGVLDKALHFLRAAGRKAMDRYALLEAEAHYERAYNLLKEAEETTDNDRAMVDLVLDWAMLHYYQAHYGHLKELLDRHQVVADRLDDGRRMWWLIWKGHATGALIDQSDNLSDLEAAVEIAESLGDEAGIAYANTWMIWAHFVRGQLDRALESADQIEAMVRAQRHIDSYPYFKSLIVSVYARASRGQFDGVRELCEEVIAFGHEVGNNRCIAFGHQGLGFLATGLGNYREAITQGSKAAGVAKDPIYRDTSHLGVSAAASLAGDGVTAREAVEHLHRVEAEGIDLPAPLFVPAAEGIALMFEGKLTQGMELLIETRDRAAAASRIWEWIFSEIEIAAINARIVTGEAGGGLKDLAKNPRFIPYLRRARKEALPHLEAVLDSTRKMGFEGLSPIVEVELAKLLIHRGDLTTARSHLESALEAVGPYGEGEGVRRIKDLLART